MYHTRIFEVNYFVNGDSRNRKIWGKLKEKGKNVHFLCNFLRKGYTKLKNVDFCLSLLKASWFISKEADTEALPLLCNKMTRRVRIQVLTSSLNTVQFIA